MSVELESKLSATIELTQWVVSIMAATVYRCVWNTIVSNLVFIVATSLACLLGTVVYYNKVVCAVSDAKETAMSNSPEIATVEITTKIDSAPITASKMTEPANNDYFPCIDLVPTDDVESESESDSDNSEEDYKEDWNEDDYTLRFSAATNNVVSDTDDNDTKHDDKEDWNEDDCNNRFPVSKSTTRAPKKESLSQLRSASKPTTTTTRAPKPKESLSQMRKRVAREMKEAEERRRQRLSITRAAPAPSKLPKRASAKTAPASTRPTRKKETVAEMKARVAREFAAKLKK
jgi:hypothetical protein